MPTSVAASSRSSRPQSDSLKNRPDRPGQILDPLGGRQVEAHGPRPSLRDDALETELERRRVSLKRELDRPPGQGLGLALQQELRRQRRPVAGAGPATRGIARAALLEEVAIRPLALLLQVNLQSFSSPFWMRQADGAGFRA